MSDLLEHSELDQQLEPLCEARHWYLGLSGGLDSTALLHLLARWSRANAGAPPLTAIHINHGLQEQADDWQVHCQWICKFLQVPMEARRVEVEARGRGLEAAAREARYQVFEDLLQAGDVLFLAHHLDDQVETFFLRLLRGAGARGLGAMPRERELGEGRLCRPLLDVPRQRLEAYVGHHGLQFVDDPSNADTELDRNYLRAELLPLLERRWPGYRTTVARAGRHVATAAQTLSEALQLPAGCHSCVGDPGLPLVAVDPTRPEHATEVLRHWLRLGGYRAPDEASLKEFIRQLAEAGSQSSPRLACRDYILRRYRDAIYLLPAALAQAAVLAPQTLRAGQRLELPDVGAVSLVPTPGPGMQLAAGESLTLRLREGGERCQPIGRGAGNSLKKLLQERSVPHWWRDRVPLLYLDDELLAVGDLWCCASSRWREAPGGDEPLWRLRWEAPVAPGFD